HGYWDCLYKAKSCVDVSACVYGGASVPTCPAGGVRCAQSTLLDCADAGAPPVAAASCVTQGQTCGNDGVTDCTPTNDGTCPSLGCNGKILRDCDNGSPAHDRGLDCSLYGAGTCQTAHLVTDAGADATISTCTPTLEAGTCTASPNVSCNAGVVTAC